MNPTSYCRDSLKKSKACFVNKEGYDDWNRVSERGGVGYLSKVLLRFIEKHNEHHLWKSWSWTAQGIDVFFNEWAKEAKLIGIPDRPICSYDNMDISHFSNELATIGVCDRTWKKGRYYFKIAEIVLDLGFDWIWKSAYLGATRKGLLGAISWNYCRKGKSFQRAA